MQGKNVTLREALALLSMGNRETWIFLNQEFIIISERLSSIWFSVMHLHNRYSILPWGIPWKRSLAGCNPTGHKESDAEEHAHMPLELLVSLPCLKQGQVVDGWFCCAENYLHLSSVQFSSVAQSCPTPCDRMNCSTPGLPVHHKLQESTQTHVHRVSDAIQPSNPLSSPSPPVPNPSQH